MLVLVCVLVTSLHSHSGKWCVYVCMCVCVHLVLVLLPAIANLADKGCVPVQSSNWGATQCSMAPLCIGIPDLELG